MSRFVHWLIALMLMPVVGLSQNLVERGSEDTPGESGGVRLDDKIAFVVEGYGSTFRIVDVFDKDNPFTISTLPLPGLTNDLDIDRMNSIAYIGAGFAGIHVVDYSDLSDPVLLGTIPNDGHSDGIELDLERDLLFNADRESSFDIYQLQGGAVAELLYSNTDGYRCRDVEVRNGLVYVVWDFHGLQIFDYTNATRPTLLSHTDLADISYDIYVDERGIAYVAGWYSGVQILDVNDPTEPVLLTTIDVPGNVRGVRMHPDGMHLVFVSETTGLYVYDVTNPSNPVQTGGLDTADEANSLEVGAEYAYVTDGDRFTIFELGDSITPPALSRVHGYVYDTYTGHTVPDARVYLTHAEAFTDENGYYYFENYVADTYWVDVSKPGYGTYHNGELEIVEGDNWIDFYIDPNVLEGEVKDQVTGELLQGASVSLAGPNGAFLDISDPEGLYKIIGIPNGDYTLMVTKEEYYPLIVEDYSYSGPYRFARLYLEPMPDIILTLTPVDPPIVIPPWGGSFEFVVTITTSDGFPQGVYDLWNQIQFPNGMSISPAQISLNLGPGMEFETTVTQQVPGIAWGGTYIYSAFVGNYPFNILGSDSFVFTKEDPVRGTPSRDAGWEAAFRTDGFDELARRGSRRANNDLTPPTEFAVRAAPNPFNGMTSISLAVPNAEPVTVRVFDITGRVVAELAENKALGDRARLQLDASRWSSGVYFLTVRTESGLSRVQKLALVR